MAAVLAPPLLTAGAGAGSGPNRLGVAGTDGATFWGLTISKRKINPGKAKVEFENRGEDPHNLLLQRPGGGEIEIAAELPPGEVFSRVVRLRRDSTYRLWCSLDNPAPHDTLGMEASLRVRNNRR